MKLKIMILLIFILIYNLTFAAYPPQLTNLGATCYMNSTLQCLYQIEPLTNFLITKGVDFYRPGTLSLTYIEFIKKIPQKTQFTAKEMHEICDPVFINFFEGSSGQQDASEFLTQILNRLSDDDVKDNLKSAKFVPHTASKESPVIDFFLPLIFTSEEVKNTPIPSNPKCKARSKSELLAKLDLPIQKINTEKLYIDEQDAKKNMTEYKTLEECLSEAYIKIETITGEDQLNCDDGSKTDFTKETKIKSSPQFLIIALKRFFNIKTRKKGFQLIKDSHAVSFPLYNLDLRPYMAIDPKQLETKYDLISFVQHSGSLGGGHYTSWVKSNGEWYFCNDSNIRKSLTEDEIKNIVDSGLFGGFTPYILFYKRRDEPELFLKQNKEALCQLQAQMQALAQRALTIAKL